MTIVETVSRPRRRRLDRLRVITGTILSGLLAVCVCQACNPLADIRDAAEGDLKPPEFYSLQVPSPKTIVLSFSEPVRLNADGVSIVEPSSGSKVTASAVVASGDTATVTLAEEMSPGREYRIETAPSDAHGNSTQIVTSFYGYNPDVPKVLINEFTTRGSGHHPDVVELRIMSAGDLGGVTVYAGSPSDWDSRIVLPSVHVNVDDYAIVHFRPQGIVDEVDETTNVGASGGYDSSDSAWDFWVRGGTGLSGNNGTLCVATSPNGEIVDAVVYSDRTSDSDTDYRGFGTKSTLTRVDEVVTAGAWKVAGASAAPEDAVDPDGSTSTRSLCRSSDSVDTDSAADWHIVPTSTETFGAPNSDEVYAP